MTMHSSHIIHTYSWINIGRERHAFPYAYLPPPLLDMNIQVEHSAYEASRSDRLFLKDWFQRPQIHDVPLPLPIIPFNLCKPCFLLFHHGLHRSTTIHISPPPCLCTFFHSHFIPYFSQTSPRQVYNTNRPCNLFAFVWCSDEVDSGKSLYSIGLN